MNFKQLKPETQAAMRVFYAKTRTGPAIKSVADVEAFVASKPHGLDTRAVKLPKLDKGVRSGRRDKPGKPGKPGKP